MNFQILNASKNDLPEILELQKSAYTSEAEIYSDYRITPLTQTIEELNAEYDNGWLILKVVNNNTIIASGRGIIIDNTAYIARLAVKKEFQNQKIGRKLLTELESRLNNCQRFELFTGYKSERNLYLYKKCGYSEFKKELINNQLTLIFLEKKVNQ